MYSFENKSCRPDDGSGYKEHACKIQHPPIWAKWFKDVSFTDKRLKDKSAV